MADYVSQAEFFDGSPLHRVQRGVAPEFRV